MAQYPFILYYLDKKTTLEPGKTYLIGRIPENDIVLPQPSVSRNHAFLKWEKQGFEIYDRESTNGTFVNDQRVTRHLLMDKDRIRIGEVLMEIRLNDSGPEEEEIILGDTMILEKKVAEIISQVDDPEMIEQISDLKSSYLKQKRKLSDLAFRDRLTGLYNRGYFDDKIQEEWERAKRYHRTLSVIMVDIDHFKIFNDTYGHQKGDEVLATVATILDTNSRNLDIVARYGGEEMVIILPETTTPQATQVAEKMRKAVQKCVREQAGVETTISLGVGTFSAQNDIPEKILKSADDALYRAKKAGRNRVEAG